MSAATSVARATCFQHPQREAAARCVGCGKPFCRECITALDRRMYCVSCFKAKTEKKEKRKRDWFLLTTATQFAAGLLVLWFTAYLIGRFLVDLPTSFHEGTVWEKLAP
jgi:hypothetical protein